MEKPINLLEFILHIKRERERERERYLRTYQLKFVVHIDDNFNTQINPSPLPCHVFFLMWSCL